MTDALSKIADLNAAAGAPENIIDEDEVIDILIELKTQQVEEL